VPFYTPGICRAGRRWWRKDSDEADPKLRLPDFERQQADATTQDFMAYLKREPMLKGVLSGHLHLVAQDRFSPTAMQYVAGGNFSFSGQMVRVI
jgi:UDP-2,3-diacylglucosamine pyrophosphatase LpxH